MDLWPDTYHGLCDVLDTHHNFSFHMPNSSTSKHMRILEYAEINGCMRISLLDMPHLCSYM